MAIFVKDEKMVQLLLKYKVQLRCLKMEDMIDGKYKCTLENKTAVKPLVYRGQRLELWFKESGEPVAKKGQFVVKEIHLS